MKKIIAIILGCAIIMSLLGCATVINTETENVKATLIDVDRDPMRVTMAGKVPVTIPADYDICLKYCDIETWIDVTRDEYERYEGLVGTTMDAILVTDHYDNNTIKQYLKLMEG